MGWRILSRYSSEGPEHLSSGETKPWLEMDHPRQSGPGQAWQLQATSREDFPRAVPKLSSVPCCSFFVGLAVPRLGWSWLYHKGHKVTMMFSFHSLQLPLPTHHLCGTSLKLINRHCLLVTVTRISSQAFNIKSYNNERMKSSCIGQTVLGRFQGGGEP